MRRFFPKEEKKRRCFCDILKKTNGHHFGTMIKFLYHHVKLRIQGGEFMRKRLCSAALALVMAVTLTLALAIPVGAAGYAGGSGTRNDP